MLLGAIVLVIGFLVLSTLVARVSQIPSETARESGGLLREAATVEKALRVANGASSGPEFNQELAHLVWLEQARGFTLRSSCGAGTAPSGVFTLLGLEGSVQFTYAFSASKC